MRFVRSFAVIIGLGLVGACSAPQPSGAAPFAEIVMDARTGKTLYERNADARLHPASLTKMLTLYIAFDAIQRGEITPDTVVTISENAASEPPSRLGLKPGQKIAMRYLIRAAAVKSANDAATAIGEAISGSEKKFAARMNRTAQALGMTQSTFRNANGLTAEGHLSTARDMTLLGRRLFYDFPQYYNIFQRRTTDAGLAEVANTNRRFLDAYEGADGIKTGFTNAAGFNLTASAERGGVRLVATIFGGTSTAHRNGKMAELLDMGFGKAPSRAPVTPPAPPEFGPPQDEQLVAELEGTGEVVNPGKTIRMNLAVATAQRPRTRSSPPLAVPAVAPPPFAVAGAEPATPAGAVMAESVSPESTVEVASAVVPAADATAAAVDAMQDEIAGALAEAGMAMAESETEMAAAVPEAEIAVAPVVVASASVIPLPFSLADPGLEIDQVASGGVAMAQQPAVPVERVAPVIHTTTPKPVEDGILVASAAPEQPVLDGELEIVTAISTSGGRHWGVNIGRFDNSAEADRVLMKTFLAESGTVGDGLRKVVQKSGGFDANIMGLTQEQADLACRRLQARGTQCFTIGQ
jgi:D-alanyl-D-alanine carboxypeptidase